MIFNENEMRALCEELGIEVVEGINRPLLGNKEISKEDIIGSFNEVDKIYTDEFEQTYESYSIEQFELLIEFNEDCIELKDEFINPLFIKNSGRECFTPNKINVQKNITDSDSVIKNAA
ncbi:hypothetical protein [Paraclostridium sordellii]|uniref:hypothetical protein n=1 Tax=Paraclostridium sordellii TaxID=1505 RepID=UPI0005E07A10|nr:hypothetical protein [Paeniclostridium sordellii]CEQ18980.1 Uncharacterised protein [[Clostridium] sordellii] [Paeniclostridium sordellii]